MKRVGLSALVGLLVMLVYVSICWLGGFNFDHRGTNVAIGAFFMLYCVAASVIFAYWSLE